MPNWNSNRLSVKGNVSHVLQFIDENFNNDLNENKNKYDYVLDFETFLPTPKDENGDIIDSWHEWRNREWGCKWSPLTEQIIRLIIYKEDGTTDEVVGEPGLTKYSPLTKKAMDEFAEGDESTYYAVADVSNPMASITYKPDDSVTP